MENTIVGFERIPQSTYARVLRAEIRRDHAGVDSLLRWWSRLHPDATPPTGFEVFHRDHAGHWNSVLPAGPMVFDARDLTAGGGAALCGDVAVVFTTTTVKDPWTSWATRMDGSLWFDAPRESAAWRTWSSRALHALADMAADTQPVQAELFEAPPAPALAPGF